MSVVSKLVRHKSVEQLQADVGKRGDFRRVLGLWQLTAIGIGGIIGVGVFVLAGQQAALNAGPAVAISFLIAGIASAAAALCYAEFAGLIPVTGSAYTYGYAVLGELAAWLIGWDLLLEYALIVAVVAIGWPATCNRRWPASAWTCPYGRRERSAPAKAMSSTWSRRW